MYFVKKKWTSAIKQEYNGFRYDSGFEANYAWELDQRIKNKEIKGYDKQVNLDLIVNGFIVCQYRIDFIAYHLDGTIEYIETKGYQTDVWKLKWKLFEALYTDIPGVKLTIVQQGNFKRPKLRKKIW
jgi:hypothetical protein